MTIDRSTPVHAFTFVALDVETTGLHAVRDRVVEFGAVRFTIGAESGEFSELAHPGMAIPPDASAVSGITDAMVAGADPTDVVLRRFIAFLGDSILVAHNAEFDMGFLRAEIQRAGLPELTNPVVDTLALAPRAFPGRKSYALQNLVAELGLARNDAHRARDDARQCRLVLERCIDAMAFMGDLAVGELFP